MKGGGDSKQQDQQERTMSVKEKQTHFSKGEGDGDRR